MYLIYTYTYIYICMYIYICIYVYITFVESDIYIVIVDSNSRFQITRKAIPSISSHIG